MEKKHWPRAAMKVPLVIFEKSTLRYHFRPCIAPGKVKDLMASMISIIKRVGIINLQAFSIPFSRPLADISPIIIRQAMV